VSVNKEVIHDVAAAALHPVLGKRGSLSASGDSTTTVRSTKTGLVRAGAASHLYGPSIIETGAPTRQAPASAFTCRRSIGGGPATSPAALSRTMATGRKTAQVSASNPSERLTRCCDVAADADEATMSRAAKRPTGYARPISAQTCCKRRTVHWVGTGARPCASKNFPPFLIDAIVAKPQRRCRTAYLAPGDGDRKAFLVLLLMVCGVRTTRPLPVDSEAAARQPTLGARRPRRRLLRLGPLRVARSQRLARLRWRLYQSVAADRRNEGAGVLAAAGKLADALLFAGRRSATAA